jgi:hypothetical protein
MLTHSILEMLVVLSVFLYCRERNRGFSASWWVIMSYPDLCIFWQCKKLAARVEDGFSAATGEVGAGGADVNVKYGIANKDVF